MYQLRCLIMFVAGITLAGSAVPAWSQSLRPTVPSETVLNRHNLTRAWWGQASFNPSRDKLVYLVVDDDQLFAQGSNGTVTSFDSESGKRLWATQLGPRDEAVFPAVVSGEVALVISGIWMYAVEKDSGDIRWKIQLPRFPSTSPATDRDNVYIGFLDGSVSALSLRTIDQLYKEHMLPQWSHLTRKWRYTTSGEIAVPPSSNGRLVAFASRNGSLYSVTHNDRNLVFQFETDAPLSAPIARHQDSLLIASEDFRIYSVNSETGTVRWQFVTGLPIRNAPIVIEDDIFLIPERGGMFDLSAVTGVQRWSRPEVEEFVAASPTQVYGTDRAGNLLIMSRHDGAIESVLPLRNYTVRVANARNDRIYMATPSGLIIALRERDRTFPRYYQAPDRQPLIPEFMPEEAAPPEADPPEAEAAE